MNILIVDDDNFKIEQVSRYLKGHNIDIAQSYNTTLRKMISNKYDGVVLDMGFPKFDDGYGLDSKQGLAVLREMDRKNIKIPTVIYSGNYFDTSEYNNVVDYIMTTTLSLKDRIEGFLNVISA